VPSIWFPNEEWNPEQAAIDNSTLPTVLDKLNIIDKYCQ
jgi:hypothetical protein